MVRELHIIVDGKKVGAISQGDSITLDIPINAKEIWGKMDWGTTQRINFDSLDLNQPIMFKAYFTLNPFRNMGLMNLPFKLYQS